MEEIIFRRPALEDQELIRSYFDKAPSRSCERTFVDVFLWARHYDVTFAVIEDTLVFRDGGADPGFAYPAGEEVCVKRALEFLMKYSEEQGYPFKLYNVTAENFAQIEAWFPGEFELEYDRDQAETAKEREEMMHQAFFADFFLGSTNAVSEDGVLVNIDGVANRVAAYAYGPKNVLLIVGMNKVVKTQEDALHRARNEAAPINAQRFQKETPCVSGGTCFDCKKQGCICSQILITRYSQIPGRIKVILVNESLGF